MSKPPVPPPADPPADAPKKRVVGRPFQKGVCPNPGGKPKAVKILRDMIAERTGDGIEMVELACAAMRGEIDGVSREYAHQWLSDRYFGKPQQERDVSVGITVEQIAAVDALKLSPHERRRRLEELRARATPALPVITIPQDDAEPS